MKGTAFRNTGVGFKALEQHDVGHINTAVGASALQNGTNGAGNTAIGADALDGQILGNFNTAVGTGADVGSDNLENATAIGANAIVDASDKIRLGNDGVKIVETSETIVTTRVGNRSVRLNSDPSVAEGGNILISRPSDGSESMRLGTTADGDAVFYTFGGGAEMRFASGGGGGGGFGFYTGKGDPGLTGDNAFIDVDILANRQLLDQHLVMKIQDDGDVAIGIIDPEIGSRLHVDGGDIRVSNGNFIDDGINLNVPDYVFENGYQMPTLEQLRAYVAREKHLPNIPSANEIKKNGLNLGQFQMQLLEKTEELVLYTLQQEENISHQEQQIATQQEQIAVLQGQNTALEDRLTILEEKAEKTDTSEALRKLKMPAIWLLIGFGVLTTIAYAIRCRRSAPDR